MTVGDCTQKYQSKVSFYCINKQSDLITGTRSRVSLPVVGSQFSDSDWYPVSIVELRVDADPLPPRPAAEQHHLVDTWRDCNRHPARTLSADKEKKKETSEYLSLLASR